MDFCSTTSVPIGSDAAPSWTAQSDDTLNASSGEQSDDEFALVDRDTLDDADNSFLAVEMIKRKPPDHRRVAILVRRFRSSFGGLHLHDRRKREAERFAVISVPSPGFRPGSLDDWTGAPPSRIARTGSPRRRIALSLDSFHGHVRN